MIGDTTAKDGVLFWKGVTRQRELGSSVGGARRGWGGWDKRRKEVEERSAERLFDCRYM
jgi:hypothetical protein